MNFQLRDYEGILRFAFGEVGDLLFFSLFLVSSAFFDQAEEGGQL